MAQAVITRRDGDVFQARMFWLHAARLLDPESNVLRVGFESGLKGFDDIWIEYDPDKAPPDHVGQALRFVRMQCKWHAVPGSFTHVDLTTPEYINATTTSLLKRALDAHLHDAANDQVSKLILVTNHGVAAEDILNRHIRQRSLNVDVNQLFDGSTPRSARGKLRKLWAEHLGIDEDELKQLCGRLGFHLTRDSLDGLRELLDQACRANGLIRPAPNASTTPYDANIFEWVGHQRTEYTRESFWDQCAQEGLLASKPVNPVYTFGVKTFEHALDRLDNRCVEVLDLVPEFDERSIRNTDAWRDSLLPRLREFLLRLPTSEGRIRLAIEAHVTLAFAAGVVLDTKSGRLVELEQRSPVLKIWAADDEPLSSMHSTWVFEEHELDPEGEGTACAISVTRNTEGAVRHYLGHSGLKLRRLLVARPSAGVSAQSVASGAHANALAEQLATKVRADRDARPSSRLERYHLFIAAPNAFTFYLGRQVAMLKPLTIYEFDFGFQVDNSYQPSLAYPEVAAVPLAI
ncbi:SAVED domain-containing protein [Pseudomonas sp. BLCC-B112]|uniref:SAVED domain-containing protein n=1 Tax=Pseudomonas sp. BLCC-B112 TaxID=3025319 RepID=UPI00234D74E8|nr:SAVED domain-containing protein [Pseudomonas sp. BLCC-B112]MDC7817364.1 SAVED domain-containing protein [Pseudomonas sp. BLCC-B112]